MNAQKKALGRGLSALLNSTPNEEVIAPDSPSRIKLNDINTIDINLVDANPWQPRTEFEQEALQELAESIKIHGLIQPITVRKVGVRFQLISGERRLRASKIGGLHHIPAYIRSADDLQMIEMALVENIQRENLNSMEIALSYQRLIDECSITQDQVSDRVGKNRTTITNYLRLLKLPTPIQIYVRDNKITMSHARALLSIDDADVQVSVCNDIINNDLSVRQVETLIRKFNQDIEIEKPAIVLSLPQSYIARKEDLKSKIDSKVEIKRNIKGKGHITIHFKSDDDFNRIIELINQ
ncbi:MAG: ParB/RepB/Spo0J family partition protein [Bacteroidota bacterium]|jgi:ParB family chromosome partitioning protein